MSTLSRVKSLPAFLIFLFILACITAFQGALTQARAAAPTKAPPLLVFAPLGIAIWLLFLGRKASSRPSAAPAPPLSSIRPVLGVAWKPIVEIHGRSLAVLFSLLLTAILWRWLPTIPEDGQFSGPVWIWLIAICLFLAGVAPQLELPVNRSWWLTQWRTVLTAALISILALFLRAWRLGTIPFTLGGDEASQGLEAIRVLNDQIRNPFSTGWLGVPTMSFFFNSISIHWLGRTVVALRLPWMFIGTASVAVTYCLVLRLKGKKMAWMTAVMVATYHFHIHYSRLGSNQIADTFFMPAALFFLVRGLEKETRLDWALSGVIAGLAMYFYAGARLTAVVLAAVLAYTFIRHPRRFWQRHHQHTAVLFLALFITASPMIQYAFRNSDEFNARLNQVGIIQSGWLAREVEITGKNTAELLFDQFQRAALAFNYYEDRTVWYGLREPLLPPFFGTLFLLGLGFATLRLLGKNADSNLAPMTAWWWAGMLLGGMLTESPPSSQRLITLSIPVCFFIALALWELLQLARTAVRGFPSGAMMGMVVVLFALNSLSTYFLDYSPQRIYGGPFAEMATEIAPHLNELAPASQFYFVGAPWMYWGFATLPYLVPKGKAVDVIEPGTAPDLAGKAVERRRPVFIFLPQRIDELKAVQAALPGGTTRDFYAQSDGRIMVTLYETQP